VQEDDFVAGLDDLDAGSVRNRLTISAKCAMSRTYTLTSRLTS